MARAPVVRFAARHVGTDMQIGAWLLVVGSALYTGYCAEVIYLVMMLRIQLLLIYNNCKDGLHSQ